MSEIKPALSAEEWATDLGSAERDGAWVYAAKGFAGVVVGRDDQKTGVHLSEDALPALIAIANAALPDDSPYKITRDDIGLIGYAIMALHHRPVNQAKLDSLAAKLEALLPPPS